MDYILEYLHEELFLKVGKHYNAQKSMPKSDQLSSALQLLSTHKQNL